MQKRIFLLCLSLATTRLRYSKWQRAEDIYSIMPTVGATTQLRLECEERLFFEEETNHF